MIDVYYWPTPNGWKITIMLEEVGLPYTIVPINIGKGEQFESEFLKIAPNNKMPAIIDLDGPDGKPISIFESGAILLYLADKTGQFIPKDPRGYWRVMEWLMFQMGTVGPMLGQVHHFRNYAPEKLEYAINRYTNEAKRIYSVIDRQLADNEFLAGDYSIADMAVWCWILGENQGQNFEDFPNLSRWRETLKARPAVRKGRSVMEDVRKAQGNIANDKERFANLFGDKQYQRR